jgi:inner membrane transporter RhtA
VPPSVVVFTGIVSVQVGAGLAGRLFSQIAPAGVTGLRLWASAIVMAVLGGKGLVTAVREVVSQRCWRDAAVAVAFGVTLAVMNFSIYQSFARIPLGIAVTIEFLGPLAVAVASSRRLLDLLWVGLAAAGVLLLTRGGTRLAPAAGQHPGSATVLTGVLFALVAAACWALYILLSRATGRRFPGSSGLVIAMVVAAIAITPVAVAAGGRSLLRPSVVGIGVAIGMLSSVIPYRLELEALRRIPPRVFGIWMSLEPAVAALVGLLLLGERLAVRQWAAIICVIIASAGAAREVPAVQASQQDIPPPAQ